MQDSEACSGGLFIQVFGGGFRKVVWMVSFDKAELFEPKMFMWSLALQDFEARRWDVTYGSLELNSQHWFLSMTLWISWLAYLGLPFGISWLAYLEHPMASALLNLLKEYCIFLPGSHYLTIYSPNGADSSLNKLLLLLLFFRWRGC